MPKSVRKVLLVGLKLVIAGLLLWYVLSKVNWRDYAVTREGRELPVVGVYMEGQESPQQFTPGSRPVAIEVSADGGGQRMAARDFRPVSIRQPDGTEAPVLKAEPDWAKLESYRVQYPGRLPESIAADDVQPGAAQVVRRGFRSTVLSAIQQRPWLLAASFLCFVVPMLMMSVRWWYLLRIQGIHIRLYESLRLTLLGNFFGSVVPGTVSGDLVKAWYVAKHTDRKAAALVSVFVDRVVGLFEFAVLPAVVMLCLLAADRFDVEQFFWPAIVVPVVLAGVFFALGLLLSARLRRVLRVRAIVRRLPMQQHVAVMAEVARIYRREWPSLLRALAITFGGQAFFISAIMLVGMSLALPVPWHLYFLYVPVICIMAAVPISPGGLGVAEYFYVLFFAAGPAGAPASEVMALALLARLLPMIVSLPGLRVAMTGVRLPKAAQMQRELDET